MTGFQNNKVLLFSCAWPYLVFTSNSKVQIISTSLIFPLSGEGGRSVRSAGQKCNLNIVQFFLLHRSKTWVTNTYLDLGNRIVTIAVICFLVYITFYLV